MTILLIVWLCAQLAWMRTGRRLGTRDELVSLAGAFAGFGIVGVLAGLA